MFAKVVNGQVAAHPYTIADLRRDNPQTSFPKDVPDNILEEYGVLAVVENAMPSFDAAKQTASSSVEMVNGLPSRVWNLSNRSREQVADAMRATRNRLLAESDWAVLLDFERGRVASDDVKAYRQALRDIPGQVGFPNTITWPEPPETIVPRKPG